MLGRGGWVVGGYGVGVPKEGGFQGTSQEWEWATVTNKSVYQAHCQGTKVEKSNPAKATPSVMICGVCMNVQ